VEDRTQTRGRSRTTCKSRGESKFKSKSSELPSTEFTSNSDTVGNAPDVPPTTHIASPKVENNPKPPNNSLTIDNEKESKTNVQGDRKSGKKKKSRTKSRSTSKSVPVVCVAEPRSVGIIASKETDPTPKLSNETVQIEDREETSSTKKANGDNENKKRSQSKSRSKSPKSETKSVVQSVEPPLKDSLDMKEDKKSNSNNKADSKSETKNRSKSRSKSPKRESKPVAQVTDAPKRESKPVAQVTDAPSSDEIAPLQVSSTPKPLNYSLDMNDDERSNAINQADSKSETKKRSKSKSRSKFHKREASAEAEVKTKAHQSKRKRVKSPSNELPSTKLKSTLAAEITDVLSTTGSLSREVCNISKSLHASLPTDNEKEHETISKSEDGNKISKSGRHRSRKKAVSKINPNESSSVKPGFRAQGKSERRPRNRARRLNTVEKGVNESTADSKMLSVLSKGGKPQLLQTTPRRLTKSKRKRSESNESTPPKPNLPHSHQQPITPTHTRRKRSESSDSLTPRHHQLKTTVHRFRYAKHIPKSILRLASTPYFHGEVPSPYLAISREGGSVELVSVNEKWKCVGQVEGIRGRNVDAMAWVQCCTYVEGGGNTLAQSASVTKTTTPLKTTHFCPEHKRAEEIHHKRRLIGASRDGTIFEVDFKSKRHLGVIGSGGGGVFCLTSLSPSTTTDSGSHQASSATCCGLFAAGCEDGSVRIYDAATDDVSGLELVCTLPSVGSAVLSIAWNGAGGSGWSGSSMAGSTLYAGVADGTIRKFECDAPSSAFTAKGWRVTTRMTVENRGRQTPTKVWALKVLTDDTVISGDSMGHIQFWDGRAGTLLQTFEHNSEKADVLDLAVNIDESKIMASGVDSKVVCIKKNVAAAGGLKDWVMTTQRRPHTNDVNSLALVYMTDTHGSAGYNADSRKVTELLCSGGVDTRVFSYAADDMAKGSPKPVYKYPQVPPLRLARQSRILTVMRCDKVDFFQLVDKIDVKNARRPTVPLDESKAYLGSITISGIHNLVSMDLTDDGKFLAVSDASSLYIFSLKFVDGKANDGPDRKIIMPTMVDLPLSASAPSSSLKFVPDGSRRLICASTTGIVTILKIQEEQNGDQKVTVEHIFNELVMDPEMTTYNFPITEIVLSPDSSFVALGRNTMSTGSINVLSIMSVYKHWYTLPCTEAPHSCLTFLGGENIKPSLVVGCSNSSFYVFDVEEKCLSDWSNDLGCPANLQLPKELNMQPDGPARLAFNLSNPNKFLMGGQNSFFSVDLDSPLPTRSKYFPDDHISARKSRFISTPNMKRENLMNDDPDCLNLTICLRYSGIIFMDFLSGDELVVVEQPWLGILSSLPDGLEKKRFGA